MCLEQELTKQHTQEPKQNFSVKDQNEYALMGFNVMVLESRHSKLLLVLEKKEIAEVFFQPCWVYIPMIQGVGMITDFTDGDFTDGKQRNNLELLENTNT